MHPIYISNPALPRHVSVCDMWTDWQHLKFNKSKIKISSSEAVILFLIQINDTLKKNSHLKLCKSSILQSINQPVDYPTNTVTYQQVQIFKIFLQIKKKKKKNPTPPLPPSSRSPSWGLSCLSVGIKHSISAPILFSTSILLLLLLSHFSRIQLCATP